MSKNKNRWPTLQEIIESPVGAINQHILPKPEEKTKGKSKYGNQKIEIDGIKFDSKREAGRFLELRMMERAGLVKDLKLQVPFELNEDGKFSYKYIADFTYFDVQKNETIVEDAKGAKTVTYKKKKKLMLKIHGINIKET